MKLMIASVVSVGLNNTLKALSGIMRCPIKNLGSLIGICA
jgi:hypothetical protein